MKVISLIILIVSFYKFVHVNTEQKYVLYVYPLETNVTEYYSKYKQKHIGDSGIDLIFPYETNVSSNGSITFADTGIVAWMINQVSKQPTSFFIFGRSSLSLLPITMTNPVAVFDAGSRVRITIPFKNTNNNQTYTIQPNTRLVQICAPDLSDKISVKVVNAIQYYGTRNQGSFGSTDK